MNKFEEIILDTSSDADVVLTSMRDVAKTYGYASIADYKDLINVTSFYPENKIGWTETDLDNAAIKAKDGGFVIVFPKAREIY